MKLASVAALVSVVVTCLPAQQVSAADLASDTLALTRDGSPLVRLTWWSSTGGTSGEFPAAELQGYVKKMSGAQLPLQRGAVVGKTSRPGLAGVVVIQPGITGNRGISADTLASLADTLRAMPPDSFIIRPVGEKIFLAGNSRRSTLYAAYEALERLGARFFAPNFAFYRSRGELIPRDPTLALDRLEHAEKPSFRYRRKYVEEGWSHTPRTLKNLVAWMAKARLNVLVYPHDYYGHGFVRWTYVRKALLPELVKRGISVEVGGHGYNSFLPQWKYRKDHPEWFPAGANIFDITNRRALTTYTRNVIDYLDRRPEIKIFDAWPPDHATWPEKAIERFGTATNAQTFVENHLRAAVTKDLPRYVRLEQLAYKSSLEIPDGDYAYDPTTILDIAPYDRSYAEPIFAGSNRYNTRFRDWITSWREFHRGPIGVCEYYAKYSWHSLPVVLPQLISQEVPFYSDQGATGFGTYSEPANWITYEMNHLWTAALTWDAQLDPDEFLASYMEERYGPAAPNMTTYLEHVRHAGQTIWDRPKGNYQDPSAVSQAMLDYTAAGEALDLARTAAQSVASRFLIDKLKANAAFALADTEISYFTVSGDLEGAAAAKTRTKKLAALHRLSGTVLQNPYLMRRYTDGPLTVSAASLYRFYRRHW